MLSIMDEKIAHVHAHTHAHTQASFPGLPEGSQLPTAPRPRGGGEVFLCQVPPAPSWGRSTCQSPRWWGAACLDTQQGTLAGFQPEPEMTALWKRGNPAAPPDSGGFPTKGNRRFSVVVAGFFSKQSPQEAHGTFQACIRRLAASCFQASA